MSKGIDISCYQRSANIDWSKLSKVIDFVIIRTGFGNSVSQTDNQFKAHIKNAISAGIKKIGVYHFNYCRSVEEAKLEARVAVEICKPYKDYISFIAFDWEYDSSSYCIKSGIKPTRELVDKMALAFKSEVEKNGYKFVLYTNPDYGSRYFTLSKYDNLWIAQYANKCSINNTDIWQFTSTGRLSGYGGNLDVDTCYNENLFFDWEEKRMAKLYKKGDNCIGVLAVKEMLIQLYKQGTIKQKVDENGIFGSGTVLAVKEAQKLSGLKQTGQIDEKTVKAIKKLVDKYSQNITVVGDVNGDGKVGMEDVTQLQREIAGVN